MQVKRKRERRPFVGAWVSPAQKNRLAALAALDGKSESEVLRAMIDSAQVQIVLAGQPHAAPAPVESES